MVNFPFKFDLFVLIIFSGFKSAEASIQSWVPTEDLEEADSNEMGTKFEEEDLGMGMASQSEKLNIEDIFGDEQVFPFPPGLGN